MTVSDQPGKDAAMTASLGEEADPWVDLARQGRSGDILMRHLAERYEEMTKKAIADLHSKPESSRLLIDVLIKQLSFVQADVFALKALVLGRDRIAPTLDWEYEDPLKAHAALLGQEVRQLTNDDKNTVVFENPASVVGLGWHDVEENNYSAWCWSGPECKSMLIVPRVFTGQVHIKLNLNVIQRDVLPAQGALEIDNKQVEYEVTYDTPDSQTGYLIAKADLADIDSPAFGIRMNLAATYSPNELWGRYDQRKLGLCFKKLTLSRNTEERNQAPGSDTSEA